MGVRSSQQQGLLVELSEWREDICAAGIGSRVALVEVPPGWGTTTVMEDFAVMVAGLDGPVALSVSTGEVPSAGRAVEAKALSDALLAPLGRSQLANLFGLDTPAGKTGLALGVGGLFVSGMGAQVALLLASLGATAAQMPGIPGRPGNRAVLARASRAMDVRTRPGPAERCTPPSAQPVSLPDHGRLHTGPARPARRCPARAHAVTVGVTPQQRQ